VAQSFLPRAEVRPDCRHIGAGLSTMTLPISCPTNLFSVDGDSNEHPRPRHETIEVRHAAPTPLGLNATSRQLSLLRTLSRVGVTGRGGSYESLLIVVERVFKRSSDGRTSTFCCSSLLSLTAQRQGEFGHSWPKNFWGRRAPVSCWVS
jgi:hypothetical protein